MLTRLRHMLSIEPMTSRQDGFTPIACYVMFIVKDWAPRR